MVGSSDADRERLGRTFDRASDLYQRARPEYPPAIHLDCRVVDEHVRACGYRNLEEGQRVEFDVGPGKKGEEAQNVRPL